MPVYYFLQTYGYDWKDRSCQRLLKSKLSEKYDNSLLFVTAKQNRSIIINNLASLENQLVWSFVAKTIILKKAAAILKGDENTFIEWTLDVSWPPIFNKLGKDSSRPSEILLKQASIALELHSLMRKMGLI